MEGIIEKINQPDLNEAVIRLDVNSEPNTVCGKCHESLVRFRNDIVKEKFKQLSVVT